MEYYIKKSPRIMLVLYGRLYFIYYNLNKTPTIGKKNYSYYIQYTCYTLHLSIVTTYKLNC